MIAINSYISYQYGYKVLSLLEFILYLTSIAFWRKIKYGGIERKIDIFCVFITLSYATYISFLLPTLYNQIWITSLVVCGPIYYMNKVLFYYQVENTNKNIITENNFYYFSLEYTNPNTIERELAYYRCVYTHGMTFHVGLCLSSIYCIMNNRIDQ